MRTDPSTDCVAVKKGEIQSRSIRIVGNSISHGVDATPKHCLGTVRTRAGNEIGASPGCECRYRWTQRTAVAHLGRDSGWWEIGCFYLDAGVSPRERTRRCERTDRVDNDIQPAVGGRLASTPTNLVTMTALPFALCLTKASQQFAKIRI
jgi:hypothetical protein